MLLAVIVVGPVLFLIYLFILANTGPNRWAAAHHMLASRLVRVALGFMSGAMAARVLPRYLWWFPGLATAGLLIAGWAVLVHVSYPRGGGPALTDVLCCSVTWCWKVPWFGGIGLVPAWSFLWRVVWWVPVQPGWREPGRGEPAKGAVPPVLKVGAPGSRAVRGMSTWAEGKHPLSTELCLSAGARQNAAGR